MTSGKTSSNIVGGVEMLITPANNPQTRGEPRTTADAFLNQHGKARLFLRPDAMQQRTFPFEYPTGRAAVGCFALRYIRWLPDGLSMGAKLLLTIVATAEDANFYRGPVRFWNADLAHRLSCSVDSLTRYRREAQEAGYLAVLRTSHRGSTEYFVTLPSDLHDPHGADHGTRHDPQFAESSIPKDLPKTERRRPDGRTGPSRPSTGLPPATPSVSITKTHARPSAAETQKRISFEQEGETRMTISDTDRTSGETAETQETQEGSASPLKPIRTGDCRAGAVETPQRAANATVEREGFRVLKHLQREWDGLIGELPIPYRLRAFQGELLDWARYRCVGAGPNWDPACLLPDLIFAARLGTRLKTAVEWAIRRHKDKLPEPKIDPAGVDFDAWHDLKERTEDERLTQKELLILQAISRQECKLAEDRAKGPGGFRYVSHLGKADFLQALLEDTGSRDLDRAERFFKLRAEA